MTFGGFQSASGKFYKYFPLKISFLASIVIFEMGSLICGVAQNSTTFIVGRAFVRSLSLRPVLSPSFPAQLPAPLPSRIMIANSFLGWSRGSWPSHRGFYHRRFHCQASDASVDAGTNRWRVSRPKLCPVLLTLLFPLRSYSSPTIHHTNPF